MKRQVILITTAILLFACAFLLAPFHSPGINEERETQDAVDNDWFMLQRVYPHDYVRPERYEKAKLAIRHIAATQTTPQSLTWESVGPSNIGGRITSLALDPTNTSIVYAGAATGGLWKSTDGATTWENVFNESASIGSVLLNPVDPTTVYVGTGESNPGGVAIYPGNGMWRSTNGGATWANIGLTGAGHLGMIAIHPSVPSRIFAAALGLYRGRTTERGIYRSTDSGASWERVLFLNDTTGACDVLIDPANPNRILAAMWTRYRPVTYSVIAGINTGLWLSTDAGDTWNQVTNGFPSNDPNLGRISLAVAPSQTNVLYASVTDGTSSKGIYKSTDSGNSWTLAFNGSSLGEGQVWYNNVLAVDPSNPDIVYAGMTDFYKSSNGAAGFTDIGGSMHVDHHAIAIDQGNPNHIIVGNDGGVFVSLNAGGTWIKSFNLPISQFYAGTIDFTNPVQYFGGTQDNGTPRTLTGSQDDWSQIYGGDGFYVLTDPTDPTRIYAETQNGGLAYSTNGGSSFRNGRTGISGSDRRNWSTPFAMDVTNPLTLYTGTFRLYRTTNGMVNWSSISGDLTQGENGRIGTITTIDVSQSDPSVIMVGADDGTVSITTDGGAAWNDISSSLPVRWVSRVAIDPDSANVVYVTHSGYLEYDFQSHIHRSTDFGQTWTDIKGNLPDLPINDVIVDPLYRPYLYIATDVGVMYSSNVSATWNALGTGLPEVPVHDLTLHSPTRKLLASTHGRSAWTIDLTGLTSVSSDREPGKFALLQNFPNPFNPSTEISYSLREHGLVTLKVFDVLGRLISTLVRRELQPGTYTTRWDANGIASGAYYYRLEITGEDNHVLFASTKRMVLVK